MDWTEIILTVDVSQLEQAEAIAVMTVPYGIYTEDYSDLEQGVLDISHVDLISSELRGRDRSKGKIHIYIAETSNPAEAISFLRERFEAEQIGYRLETGTCSNADWENNWKKYFKPMPMGKQLYIRPAWIDEYDPGDRKVLTIEPGSAFGSGTHETTRLCLCAMEPWVNDQTKLLDVGCGSGILALCGLLLGAEHATGVDIDPMAVKTAGENAALNGIGADRLTLLTGNLADEVSGTFDLIVANIVADAIIALSRDVGRFLAPHGRYIVSGIIAPRQDDVIDALTALGFEIAARHEENEWICFECVPGGGE